MYCISHRFALDPVGDLFVKNAQNSIIVTRQTVNLVILLFKYLVVRKLVTDEVSSFKRIILS